MTIMQGIDPTNGREINLNFMVLISLAIHILILSGGAFIQVSSSPRMTFGPVYSVQLVGMSAAFRDAAPASALSKEITAADSRDRSVVLRKTTDALSKIPIQKMDAAPTRSSQVDRALDQIRKKAEGEPEAPSRGAPQGQQGTADGNARLNDYYGVIWSRIKSQWALPGGILPKSALESVVHVRILRNGSLMDIYLDKRSGNTYFDNSALRAVTKSNPLPPLPAWYRESSLDVGIRFHSSELR
jgi:colicin import membrane protein